MVILAAGISSRMKKPATDENLDQNLVKQANEASKGLIRLGKAQLPFLDYLLNNMKQAGFREFILVIGENSGGFRAYYGTADQHNDYHGLDISYAVQSVPPGRTKPWGTADALFQALDQYPEWAHSTFCMCNSDNYYSKQALKLLREFPGSGAWINYDRDGFNFSKERVSSLSVTIVDDEGYLIDFMEKPKPADIEKARNADGTVRVSFNLFKFSYDLFYPYLRDCPVNPVRLEKELPTAVLNMVRDHPHAMKAIPLKAHVPDMTSKSDLPLVQNYLDEQFPEFTWGA